MRNTGVRYPDNVVNHPMVEDQGRAVARGREVEEGEAAAALAEKGS
jgi:hypothetical protein